MKTFHVRCNIGKAKYVVSFHKEGSFHKDGSEFFDCRIFSNKKKLAQFVRELQNEGYKET
jgi:hypothetical protein